jgi:hypothetical protein
LLERLAALVPSPVGETMGTIGVYQDTAFARNFEPNLFALLFELLFASVEPFLAIGVYAIRGPVLGLVRADGRMEDVRGVLDLEVEGVVFIGNFLDGAKDVLLSGETEGTILWRESNGGRSARVTRGTERCGSLTRS